MLDQVLAAPQQHRLSQRAGGAAWNYAYRFFFEYPLPFPWHLLHFWNELESGLWSAYFPSKGRLRLANIPLAGGRSRLFGKDARARVAA